MKIENLKALAVAVKELNESYMDTLDALNGTAKGARETKKLWKSGRKPVLVQLGLALIAFPEPFVSDIVGTLLVAAGMVQAGIRRRMLYFSEFAEGFAGYQG
jgi:hypothetical protein